MKLKDRVAIIFGGTSGLGEATAKAYADEGAKLVVVGRDKSKGNRIISELQSRNQESIFVEADVSKAAEVQAVVNKTLEKFEQIDILYNGAGIHDAYKTAIELDEDEYEKLMDINVKGPYLASKAVIPHFLKRGKGVIINIGSQSTHVAGAGGSAYVTSKHAIEGFTKQLAYDFGSKGIKANLIAPGFIESPMTEGIEDKRLNDIPAQRAGKPEEIAALAVFLASDDSNYMHGSTVTMDGGWTTGR
ncbi:SDR family oxidoreductase [Pistricoccus aurantiacus]|uniref:SDR family oxidoreductase n=1 Tax=Pistricoccus aurantiacus TaxID=1883414 RepID=A0A5B8SPN0_9GAMM|nr:SDR family NAD(P)-dependent oxidoreductase [Pistricoccus aurantiacus]QEA38736.1 SDR family oxidoreductase [Pistricoccus aurantiacus]